MMTDLREILLANFEKVNVDKIQSRWCSGDSPDLFKERWEKLFEDWVGVKKEKVCPRRYISIVCRPPTDSSVPSSSSLTHRGCRNFTTRSSTTRSTTEFSSLPSSTLSVEASPFRRLPLETEGCTSSSTGQSSCLTSSLLRNMEYVPTFTATSCC